MLCSIFESFLFRFKNLLHEWVLHLFYWGNHFLKCSSPVRAQGASINDFCERGIIGTIGNLRGDCYYDDTRIEILQLREKVIHKYGNLHIVSSHLTAHIGHSSCCFTGIFLFLSKHLHTNENFPITRYAFTLFDVTWKKVRKWKWNDIISR